MSTKKTSRTSLGVFLAILFALGSLLVLLKQKDVYAGTPGSVIINEIMYNPVSDNQDDEFLELYNTTASPINLEGWCFSEGITLVTSHSDPACFSAGTIIPANGYLIVSPNSSQTNTSYGLTPAAVYTGTNLSNGGETITLVDETAQVIDTVTYDDIPPWPTSVDGGGPSLELRSPELNNENANSWGASVGGATPMEENSIVGSLLPQLTNLSVPQNVTAQTSPTITINAENADSVNLIYRVMFNQELTLQMYDDGQHGDGAAGDDVFGATIPQQTDGQLVRYKVEATNTNGLAVVPGGEDTIEYKGYTVSKQIDTELPVFQFFMEPALLQDMITNHSFDDEEFPCVVAYGNTVIDSSLVHIKGQTTRNLVKKAFAIDLPKGHLLQMADMTRPVDEFHLNSTYLDASGVVDVLGWRLAEELGMPTTQMFKVRLQHNAEFYGLYTFAEEYDRAWREQFGYQTGSFYKGGEKKTRLNIDDGTERTDWGAATQQKDFQTRFSYALQKQDIPNSINLMAYQTFIRNWDVTFGKNLLVYFDHGGSERWQMMPYDLDSSFYSISTSVPGIHYVSPYEMPGTGGEFKRDYRAPLLVLYDHPQFKQNYYRRLRTIADEYLATGWLKNQLNQLIESTEIESVLDYQKWGSVSDPAFHRATLPDIIDEMELNIFKRFQKPWAVPEQQSANPVVEISAIDINLADRSLDSVTLVNNTNEAIDMSGWEVPELAFTLPIGSVIAPGQSAILARSNSTYTDLNPDDYVLGQFNQNIPSASELSLKRKNGTTSDAIVTD
jgi:hypothetical protein